MRTKTRTTLDIKTGMVIRLDFSNGDFRQVADVKPGPWPNTRYITFTDGTGDWHHIRGGWQVARGKTARKTVKARTANPQPTAMESVFALLGGYATATVGAR